MAWTVDYNHTALNQLRKLDKQSARRILDFLDRPKCVTEASGQSLFNRPRTRSVGASGKFGAVQYSHEKADASYGTRRPHTLIRHQ